MDIGASSNQRRLLGHVTVKEGGQEKAVVCCHGDFGCCQDEEAAGWVHRCGFHPGNTNIEHTNTEVCQHMEGNKI